MDMLNKNEHFTCFEGAYSQSHLLLLATAEMSVCYERCINFNSSLKNESITDCITFLTGELENT